MKKEDLIISALEARERRERQREMMSSPLGWILLAALCLMPYIWTCNYISFCLHKNQIVLHETTCVGVGWREESDDYHSGEYYVDFAVDADFKRYDVSSFEMHTLVFKGERCIGHIKTHFSENQERRTSQTLRFGLSENQISTSDDSLFRELYYGDLTEYRFESRVIFAWYQDGTTVGVWLPMFYEYDEQGNLHYNDG